MNTESLVSGKLIAVPLVVKLEIKRGEFVLLERSLYEVYRMDKFHRFIHLTWYSGDKSGTQRCNLDKVTNRGSYLMLETETESYEVKLEPKQFKEVLHNLYNKVPMEAELITNTTVRLI